MKTDDSQRAAPGDPLDLFFEAAKEVPPTVDARLLTRVLTDARQVQAARTAPAAPQRAAALLGGWFWREVSGGWGGFGGLVAASATGLWLGFAAPEALTEPLAGLIASEDGYALWPEDFLSSVDVIEGG